jgi:hypothetical protein
MAMELADLATHGASALGGSVTIGLVAKILIQNWIKSKDEQTAKNGADLKEHTDKTGTTLTAVVVELAKIGVRLDGLQRTADASTKYGESIAVLQSKLEDTNRCLNGLGQKVRNLGNGA